jgi:hypothetical protein
MSRDGGKGDKQRPLGVPQEQFDNNWDTIFKTAKFLKENIKLVNEEFDKEYDKLEQNK